MSKDFILMTAIAFILFMSRGIIQPVHSLYIESLGANYFAIGLLGTTTSLTMIIFSYIWGRTADYVGKRKRLLIPGLAALAISYGLRILVPHYGYLFPLNIVSAIAQAAYDTAGLALIGDLLEQREGERGRRMGTYRGLCSLGFGLMAFVSGSLADWLSIRVPFGLSAAFLGLAFILALQIDEADTPVPPKRHRLTPRQLLRDGLKGLRAVPRSLRDLWHTPKEETPGGQDKSQTLPLPPLLISAFLWSLAVGAVYAVWANYMVKELLYSQAAMSRLWAIASLSEFPLMILAGWLSDRIGRLPMLSLGFLAWALVFLGYVVTPMMPWMLGIQLLRGFAYSAFTATAMTYATEVRARSQRGQVSGLYSSAGGLGAILGSSLGGLLTQLTNFRTMIAACAALIFGGAVYLALAAARHVNT